MKNNKCLINWTIDDVFNSYLDHPKDLAGDQTYYWYLYPYSSQYYSILNPLFFFSSNEVKLKKIKSVVLVRDGLFAMIYLMKNSRPQKDVRYLVDAEFAFAVNEEWRESVDFYSVECNNFYGRENLPKNIILFGSLNSTLSDYEYFNESVKELATKLGGKDNLKDINIHAYFSITRNDLWGNWGEENVLEWSKTLFSELKFDINFPKWENLSLQNNFKDYLYYEVNSKHFIADTYTRYHCLSKGAGMLAEENQIKSGFELIGKKRISLYHSMNILRADEKKYSAIDPFASDSIDDYKKFFSSISGDRKLKSEWDSWFASYVKKYYKDLGKI